MKEYYITFGQKYHREEHPVLGDFPTLPDGYWVVTAESKIAAKSVAFQIFGESWSMVYGEEPELGCFPRGRLNPKIRVMDTVSNLLDPSLDWRVVHSIRDDELWLDVNSTVPIGPFPTNNYWTRSR